MLPKVYHSSYYLRALWWVVWRPRSLFPFARHSPRPKSPEHLSRLVRLPLPSPPFCSCWVVEFGWRRIWRTGRILSLKKGSSFYFYFFLNSKIWAQSFYSTNDSMSSWRSEHSLWRNLRGNDNFCDSKLISWPSTEFWGKNKTKMKIFLLKECKLLVSNHVYYLIWGKIWQKIRSYGSVQSCEPTILS